MRSLELYTAAGVKQTPDSDGVYTLANGTVYYAELKDRIDIRADFSVDYEWDDDLVAAITVEATNRPESAVAAYAATGWKTTGATTISPASSASSTLAHYTNFVAGRARIKIDVTTGGEFSAFEHSKQRGAR